MVKFCSSCAPRLLGGLAEMDAEPSFSWNQIAPWRSPSPSTWQVGMHSSRLQAMVIGSAGVACEWRLKALAPARTGSAVATSAITPVLSAFGDSEQAAGRAGRDG